MKNILIRRFIQSVKYQSLSGSSLEIPKYQEFTLSVTFRGVLRADASYLKDSHREKDFSLTLSVPEKSFVWWKITGKVPEDFTKLFLQKLVISMIDVLELQKLTFNILQYSTTNKIVIQILLFTNHR